MSTTEATNDTGALNKQHKIYIPGGGMTFPSALPHSDFQPPARVRSTPPSLAEQNRPGNYFPQKSMRGPQRPFYSPQVTYPNARFPMTASPSVMAAVPAVHPVSPTDTSRVLGRGRPPSPSVPGGGGDTTPRGGRGSGRGRGRLARNGEMEPHSPNAAG